MNIPWKLKSFVFRIIDIFNIPHVLYFLQKNITKRSKLKKINSSSIWKKHEQVLKKNNSTDFIFEFGAGKSLIQNLFISNFVKNQLVVDLNPMIDLSLVEDARIFLCGKFYIKEKTKIKELKDLLKYGIKYIAPFDASKTNLQDESVDGIISSNTLEHIPKKNLIEIFNELHRVLKKDGIISLIIDYSDHYAHTDKSITLLNYLRFDDEQWKKFNHKCHFQNRLRHYDYINIFRSLDFNIIKEDLEYKEKNVLSQIKDKFQHEDKKWQATSAHIVLKKNNLSFKL